MHRKYSFTLLRKLHSMLVMFRYSLLDERVQDRVLSISSLQQQGILSLSELSVIGSDKHGCM